jgi:ATP/maltotriose-dependent transcriptional regulator MalT
MASDVEELTAIIEKLEQGARVYETTQAALKERVKELNCFHGLAQLVEKENITLPEILQGTVDIIPPAWQYPEVACASLKLENRTYTTAGFQRTVWRQSAPIRASGNIVGTLEVCYIAQTPNAEDRPFLQEEERLLGSLCERLGRIFERYQSEKALSESRTLLRIQKAELERKNAALQELLLQLELERNRMESNIRAHVDTIMIPILTQMRTHGHDAAYIDLLSSEIIDLTSSFASTLKTDFSTLSPRETEICHMIKSGLTSKEIGTTLGLSGQTVAKHRSRIRHKLLINGEKINLVSFLRAM